MPPFPSVGLTAELPTDGETFPFRARPWFRALTTGDHLMNQRPLDTQHLLLVLLAAAGTFYVAAVHPSLTEPIVAAAAIATLVWIVRQ